MQKLLSNLITNFTNDNPRKVYCFREIANPEFYKLIQDNHDGMLPNDFIFDTFRAALLKLQDYEIENENQFEEYQGEIADSMTPIYTYDLMEHFRQFPEYAEAAKTDNCHEESTLLDCITMGAYLHCSEILCTVFDFVNEAEKVAA